MSQADDEECLAPLSVIGHTHASLQSKGSGLVVFCSLVRSQLGRQYMSKHLPHRASARLMSGQRAEDQSESLNLTGNFKLENGTRRYTVRPLVNVPEREAFNVSTPEHQ